MKEADSGTHGYTMSRTIAALLVLSERTTSASDLAVTLRVHPRTARRYLRRLVHEGYAKRTSEGFQATPLLQVLGFKLAGRPLPRPPGARDHSFPPGYTIPPG